MNKIATSKNMVINHLTNGIVLSNHLEIISLVNVAYDYLFNDKYYKNVYTLGKVNLVINNNDYSLDKVSFSENSCGCYSGRIDLISNNSVCHVGKVPFVANHTVCLSCKVPFVKNSNRCTTGKVTHATNRKTLQIINLNNKTI
jgi:hypothetical protein